MTSGKKWLLGLFLGGVLLVILLTWGSVGSAVLTLALLLCVIFLLLRRTLDARDEYLDE